MGQADCNYLLDYDNSNNRPKMSCKASVDVEQEEQDVKCNRQKVTTIHRVLDRLKRRENSIKRLTMLFLLAEMLTTLFNDNNDLHQTNQNNYTLKDLEKQSLARGLLHVIVLVAANNGDAYAEASAESPAADLLEDDDEDDEELNASASNDYPDAENDESYEDGDDDRQETRITAQWVNPTEKQNSSSLFTISA